MDRRLEEVGPLVAEMLRETVAAAQDRRRQDLKSRARGMLNAGRGAGHPERVPFHWAVEFPEVFDKGGFDAFVGNPPFMGGLKLETALGTDYRAYLVHYLGNDIVGVRGTGDLCAYFALRLARLLRSDGMLGILATNTIAQGDTLRLGLDQLVTSGLTISRAISTQPWPGTANLEIAHVWMRKGQWLGESVLNGRTVTRIQPQLQPTSRITGKPRRLLANNAKCFTGSYVLSLGFTMSPAEAAALISNQNSNRNILLQYLNGKDLNSDPAQRASRWIINFRDWPLDRQTAPQDYRGPVASDYPECLDIVRRLVKPERDAILGRNDISTRRGLHWWRYAGEAKYLYEALVGLNDALALCLVNNHLGFVRVPSNQVFAHKLAVFPLSMHEFAILQSSLHYHWAWAHCSTMRVDINYSPTDAFETFPFPTLADSLDTIGERYHEHRRQLMLARQEGLTKTYNHFHDPRETSTDIVTLRALHVEMDQAVAAAYGWTDLDLGHDFHETKQGTRYTISEPARREVLDRLLELNHQRYAEEVAQGLHDTGKKPKPAKPKPQPEPAPPPPLARPGQQTGFAFDAGPLFFNVKPQIPAAAPPAPAPPPSIGPTLSPAAAKLRDAIAKSYGPAGKAALVEAAGIAENEWAGAIRELIAAGLAEQQGERRGARYVLKKGGQG